MAEEASLTALSGEIMAGPAPDPVRRDPGDQVEDAVFETVRDVRAPLPAPVTAAIPSGMQSLGAAPIRGLAPVQSSAGLGFWSAGAALALAAFWFAGGHVLASRLSQAEAEPAVRVAALTTQVLHQGGKPLLQVDGTLENATSEAKPLPPLSVTVTDSQGRVTRHHLGQIDGRIAANGKWRFSSRLEAPRSGVSAVTVTVSREPSS